MQLDHLRNHTLVFTQIDITDRKIKVVGSVAIVTATADITGDFTLHGVTRPLTLHARFVGAGINPLDQNYTVGFSATGSFLRSQFGVAKYVPLVGDEVSLTLSGAFELKK